MMIKEELKKKLDEAGLGRGSDTLYSLSRMSVRFTTTQSTDEEIPIGTSKVGGTPDLPSNISFPEWKDEPLAFLAQINLADIADFQTSSELPSSGILSFFYHVSQPWGYDPKDMGAWRVLYFDDLQRLNRVSLPTTLPDEGYYLPCSLSFFEDLTLPYWESIAIKSLRLTREEMDAYVHLTDGAISFDKNHSINRILGYPDPVQGDMQLECQLVSNGIYCDDAKSHLHPRYHELKPGSADWNLLMQLDSEETNAKMSWGLDGRIYFWIHQTALKNREFQKVWLILQCT